MALEKNYETVEVFTPNLVSGIRYGDAVGDYNLVHRSDSEAIRLGKKLGLEKAVAAGMGVLAHAQGSEKIRNARFKFSDFVYYGSEVAMQRAGIDYRFVEGGKSLEGARTLYEGSIELGEPSGEILGLPQTNLVHNENSYITKKDVRNYLDAAGKNINLIETPDLFLMSLPAAAMVNHARRKGKGGIHTHQSIEIHRPWSLGDVQVSIFQKRLRLSAFQKYSVYWTQKGLVIASGEAIFSPLDLE